MAAVRRFSRWAHFVSLALFQLGVVVQFLLAGFAIFGAMSFDPHEMLGFTVLHLLSLLVFLFALLGWIGRNQILLSALLFVLATVQIALPASDNGWLAGLHPLSALVLFVLTHYLMRHSRERVMQRALPAAGQTAAGNAPAR